MRTFEISQPGDPTVLGFADRDAPVVATGQLLIRVDYAGLNFTDVLARRGAPGYASGWPFVPGMEVAGTVAAIGETVEGYEVGDTVVAFTPDGGGLAELVCADARLSAHIPRGLDLATAAGMPLTWATALGLVRRAHLEPGDKVLVTSAGGGVGVALASVLAAADPAVIVGGVGSAAKRDRLSERYVPVLRDAEFYAAATAVAGGPFDVVLDSLGGDVLGEAVNHLAVGARLISYGGAAGQSDPATPAYPQLRAGNQTVSGFSILRLARTVPARAGFLIRGAIARVESSSVPAPRIISWDQLVDAHVEQSEGHAIGKTVVQVP